MSDFGWGDDPRPPMPEQRRDNTPPPPPPPDLYSGATATPRVVDRAMYTAPPEKTKVPAWVFIIGAILAVFSVLILAAFLLLPRGRTVAPPPPTAAPVTEPNSQVTKCAVNEKGLFEMEMKVTNTHEQSAYYVAQVEMAMDGKVLASPQARTGVLRAKETGVVSVSLPASETNTGTPTCKVLNVSRGR